MRIKTVKYLFVGAILILLCVGCRIKTPSLEEQQLLSEKGAFGTGTPAWVIRSARHRGRTSDGLLSISGPEGITSQPVIDNTDRLASAKVRPQEQTLSPLEKLAQDCPSAEAQINDALTTLDVVERVFKYEAIVSRCPRNEQLLLWLAEDYMILQDFSEARRTINKILTVNSDSAEARELMLKIQQAR